MSEQLEKHIGEYAIRPVHKRMPLVQKNGFALALIFNKRRSGMCCMDDKIVKAYAEYAAEG